MTATETTWISKASRILALALAVTVPAAIVLTTGTAPAVAQAGPDGEVDLETFHRELSPYGKWFEHPKWGEVWRPDVESDWRPYTRGHWSWTDEHGWYWVAEEEWGWGPFHYGRWVHDEDEEEWLWIPGTDWAPAWVQWRESEDAVGWAPLPPDSLLDGGSLRLNATAYDSPRYSRYWVFAAPAVMFLPGLYRHILPVSRYSTVWRNTRHVSFHHRIDRGRIFHPGIDHRRIERWSGRSVPVITLRPVSSARDTGWRRMRSQTEVPVYRPRVVSRTDVTRIQRPVWGTERRDGRDGRPRVDVTPRPDTSRGGDGRRDGGRNDWGRSDGSRNDGSRNDGTRGDRRGEQPRSGDDAARRQQEQVRQQQEQAQRQQQQDTARRQQDTARQQQDAARQQQEAARRQQEQARQQDAARQQQEAARRQQEQARQQDAARQQQEAARRQQEQARQQDAARQQQEAARRQQDAVRQQQEAARRQQEQARQQQQGAAARGQAGGTAAGDGGRRSDGQPRGGEARRDGKRNPQEEPKKN